MENVFSVTGLRVHKTAYKAVMVGTVFTTLLFMAKQPIMIFGVGNNEYKKIAVTRSFVVSYFNKYSFVINKPLLLVLLQNSYTRFKQCKILVF